VVGVRQSPPVIYQDSEAGRQAIAGSYVMNDVGEIGFAVGAYDPARALIIDPVLANSTFLGLGRGLGIAVDAAGNAYVARQTGSPDFPTTPGAFQRTPRGSAEVFVSKLSSTGTRPDLLHLPGRRRP
jgi:hypothetical protein